MIEALVTSLNNMTNTITSLFVFTTDEEPMIRKTRSNIRELIEEEVLLFSREVSKDSALIFKKAKDYPYLSALSTRLLCVPVERMFSNNSFTIRPQRSRLMKEMLAKLTLLKCSFHLFQ